MHWWGVGMGPSWLCLGLILVVVLLAGLAAVAALVITLVSRRGPGGTAQSGWSGDALETLRQRYARSEITREEFERMKEDLR